MTDTIVSLDDARRKRQPIAVNPGVEEGLFSLQCFGDWDRIQCVLNRPDPLGIANVKEAAEADHAVATALEAFSVQLRERADIFARDDRGAFLGSVQIFAGGVAFKPSELAGRMARVRAMMPAELRKLADEIEKHGVRV